MGKKAKAALLVVGVVGAVVGMLTIAGTYLRVVAGGKTVREGIATVVAVRDMKCEEANRDSPEESGSIVPCSPGERGYRPYLRIAEFKTLDPADNNFLLQAERTKESEGFLRCTETRYYVPQDDKAVAGDRISFQFQFFDSFLGSGRSALIFLDWCKKPA